MAPLSPYSKVFYNEWKLFPARIDYNIVFDQNLYGYINTNHLLESVKRCLSDYVIFNCHVEEKNSELHWVKNKCIFDLEYITRKVTNEEILLYVKEPFDLEKGPLYRCKLIKINDYVYRFIIVLHHILIDGSTFDVFIDEISRYYNDTAYKAPLTQEVQFLKISVLSKHLSDKIERNRENNKQFWGASLSDFESPNLNLIKVSEEANTNAIAPEKQFTQFSDSISQKTFSFSANILKKLNKIRDTYSLSPYLYGQIIYAILINKYTGQDKFCLSYPISISEGKEFFYGASINTNFIPYNFNKINNIIDIIYQVKEFVDSLDRNGQKHNYLPVAQILEVSDKSILGCIFSQTNFSQQTFKFLNSKATVNNTNVNLHHDFSFEQEIRKGKVCYRVKYKDNKIDTYLLDEFIKAYKKLFIDLLENIANVQDNAELIELENYNLLSKKQYEKIIHKWNKTQKKYPINITVQELFENQVEKTPDKIALTYEEKSLTYKELNEKSNQLANYLRSLGVHPETLIAVVCERSLEMMVSLLGILKAGSAYVPLDSNYQIKQLQFILNDTQATIILTDKKTIDKIPATFARVIAIDEEWDSIGKYSFSNPHKNMDPNNLAYVIYTSGTTANPKGVMVTHRGVTNYISNIKSYITAKDNVDFSTNIGFDLTITTTLCSLCLGAKVTIYGKQLQDLDSYKEHLIKNCVTVIKLVPSYFEFVVSFLCMTKVKKIILGGEKLNQKTINKLYDLRKNYKNNFDLSIYDEYGPTEATVGTCNSRVYPNKHSTIGKPYKNYRVYVLDTNLSPVPLGVIGELYIGGLGLARGYLNRPDLTAEKFIPNPFLTPEEKKQEDSTRLYKTGDLVRWLPGGNLEYIGRNDFQVKIRGYRIELEGIEKVLSGYEGIKQCVVIAKERVNTENESESKYLVVYYLADKKLDEVILINYLQARLPEYMVPSSFIYLEKLPFTINGKLDKKALPDPEFTSINNNLSPRNELEKKICMIWSEILGLPEHKIGIQDDFFKLGGDSLLIARLMLILKKKFSIETKISELLVNNTVDKLAKVVNFKTENKNVIDKK